MHSVEPREACEYQTSHCKDLTFQFCNRDVMKAEFEGHLLWVLTPKGHTFKKTTTIFKHIPQKQLFWQSFILKKLPVPLFCT